MAGEGVFRRAGKLGVGTERNMIMVGFCHWQIRLILLGGASHSDALFYFSNYKSVKKIACP